MKTILLSLTFLLAATAVSAQSDIKLNAPDKTGGKPLMQAFSDRRSDRVFDTKELSAQDLSDLLWAANGVNRADGKRTAPSAMDRKDVIIYAFLKSGVYVYDAPTHTLKGVVEGDHRGVVGGNRSNIKVAEVPVILVLASDVSLFGGNNEGARMTGAQDVAMVSQNINLLCAGKGLSTVTRGSMDTADIKKLLNLPDHIIPMLNNLVGYPKK